MSDIERWGDANGELYLTYKGRKFAKIIDERVFQDSGFVEEFNEKLDDIYEYTEGDLENAKDDAYNEDLEDAMEELKDIISNIKLLRR